MREMTARERITAAIIGGAIGDALGVPVEFEERDSFTVTDMIGGGTHKQPVGSSFRSFIA
ncbi:ADP-ribosylglycohydrolase [Fibrobacteria bacterium R8-3-H12]